MISVFSYPHAFSQFHAYITWLHWCFWSVDNESRTVVFESISFWSNWLHYRLLRCACCPRRLRHLPLSPFRYITNVLNFAIALLPNTAVVKELYLHNEKLLDETLTALFTTCFTSHSFVSRLKLKIVMELVLSVILCMLCLLMFALIVIYLYFV